MANFSCREYELLCLKIFILEAGVIENLLADVLLGHDSMCIMTRGKSFEVGEEALVL